MKRHKNSNVLLLIILISSSLIVTAAGVTIKHTVARSNEQIQNTMAIAVPFLLLRGDPAFQIENATPDDSQTEMETEEEIPPPQRQPNDSKPSEPSETQEIPPQNEDGKLGFAPVEEAYFDTALFIGDSRTVGFSLYGRLGKADYFADVGMSSFNLFQKSVKDNGFESQTLRSLLQTKHYQTIYIMLGINEIGYPLNSIEKKLTEVLEEIHNLQPDAILVLEANLGVTKAKEAKSPLISMQRIRELNQMIADHADGIQTFYLDVNPYFADEDGYLRSDVTSDGTHPYATEYKNWAIWLKGYGIKEISD